MKTKDILRPIIVAGIITSTLASCDVERFPHDAIEQSQSFQKVSDGIYWNNIIYSQMRGRVYGIYTYSTDVQADQLNASIDYGNRNGAPHRWTFFSDDYTIRDVWAGYYGALANINVMLAGFETITPTNEDEASQLNLYKGDAHFARAYYYFNLVVRYAKMYDPATASSDLGVPLILEYDLEAKPPRNTVQEVYDQILNDLTVAKSFLSGRVGESGASRFTVDVVTALEARVKLYMQDWNGARVAAQSLISSGTYPLYNSAESIAAMWHRDLGQEDIFSPIVSQPNETAPTNNIYQGYNLQNDRYTPDFLPSQWVVDAFDDEDFRKGAYFKNVNVYFGDGVLRPNFWIVNKYPGNPDYFTSATTNYMHKQKVFRIAEAYLIAAEAAYRINQNDATGVLTPINALRIARGLAPLEGLTGEGLFDAVKEERFKELAFEGFRLDDLRRWGEGFTRRDPQSLDVIQTGPDFHTKTVQAGDLKFTWGIPTRDETINPNIVQNPGW